MTSCCQSATSCCNKAATSTKPKRLIALVGNPNCGKTTLFNALTGSRQRVGNWSGVTVERKSGFFTQDGITIEVVDLPGVYSMVQASETAALDEKIACEFILSQQADVIINIVDASNLERHLYLTSQLREMGAPVVLALNMMDVAHSRQIYIDTAALARELDCPVIELQANHGRGVRELKRAIVGCVEGECHGNRFPEYPEAVKQAIKELNAGMKTDPQQDRLDGIETPHHSTQPFDLFEQRREWVALRLLEDDRFVGALVSVDVRDQVKYQQRTIREKTGEDADILLADARYRFIQRIIQKSISHSHTIKTSWTARVDSVVLNRLLGIPVFLGIMYFMFFFSINVGGAFQDFFDISSQTIFVDGLAYLLTHLGAPVWLTALLANGVGKGVNTTITFIPVIGSMFLFLSYLEDSGYMARAAFVIDRFMRALGLPGKAFVPMIVGFGCNVPAVLGARTLDSKRDRILTIMMTPFMSCGARLAIYAVFIAAFFPHGGQNIVFALYLIGIMMAVLTGFLLRHTALKGEPSPFVMELPLYHVPQMRSLLLHTWQRLKGFVFRAGKLIVPICVFIGALNAINIDGSMNPNEGDVRSLLSMVGQWATPIFTPMGIQADNWPATVGLVTGVLAKEVVVGTLNTLYSQVGHFTAAGSSASFHLWPGLWEALRSVPQNLGQLTHAIGNPILAQAPMDALDQGVYGMMYKRFDGKVGAFAYLLFILLYFPCVSTMAAMMRELHRGWSIFSGLWMTGVAYGAAVFFYQAATWTRHPVASTLWIGGIVSVFTATIVAIRSYTKEKELTKPIPALQPVAIEGAS